MQVRSLDPVSRTLLQDMDGDRGPAKVTMERDPYLMNSVRVEGILAEPATYCL